MTRLSETLLDHARRPHNFGRDDHADVIGQGNLDGGPPTVDLYLRLDGGAICGATFHAAGCGVTVAAGSALTDLVLNHSLAETNQIDQHTLESALDGVPADKSYCLIVALEALRNAVAKAELRTTDDVR